MCRLHRQDLTIRPPAAARKNSREASRPRGGRDNRAPATPQLQPPHDRKQTTRKPANTRPARRARVETGTASNEMAAPWCATPADDHAHEHNRTPQLYHYERGPTNVDKPHYTALGPTKTQLASADTDVPAAQTTFGDTTTGSSATKPTQTKPTMRRPRQPRTDHTAAAAAT